MIKKIIILSFIVLLCSTSYFAFTNAGGPPLLSTNAPSEGDCTGCHSGTLITSSSNSDWNTIALTSNFSSGNGYLPDSTYTIVITHSQSGISKWGFQTTVLDTKSTPAPAGTLAIISGATREQYQKGSNSREYIYHNSTGTSSTSTNATSWSFKWTAPKNIGDVKFYTCVNAANNDNTNNGDQIFAKIFTIKPSTLIPIADATCKDSVTCAGNTITMNAAGTQGANKWSWSFPGTGVSPSTDTSRNPKVKYNIAGTYYAFLVATNTKASSLKDSIKIVVNPKPSALISPNAGTYTICKGDSVKLSCLTTGVSYLWSPLGATVATVWAKDTGNYTVTTTNNNKCSAVSGIIKIAFNPIYTIDLTRDVSNDTICFERPVKVTATGTTTFDTIIYLTSTGPYQRTSINPQTFKFSTSTDLFARGKDAKGCVTAKSNSFKFVVKTGVSAPTANCTNKTTTGFEITWGAVTNALGYKVSIDSGKTWQTPSSGNKGLSHKVSGFPLHTDIEVQLKALDIFPCNESDITKIICGSIPCSPLTYDIIWDKEVCKSNLINFRIRNLSTNFFSLKIDNGKSFKDTAFTITADFSRTYKFELTDSGNLSCPTIKRDAAVKVWEIPSLILSSNNPQNIFCQGNTATFDVVAKGMQEYNFFLNTVSKQKSNVSTWNLASPKNLDSVWVTVTNGACVSTSDKIKLGIKPLPTAKFTYSFNGRTATFNASETGKAKFQWSFGDGNKDTSTKTPSHKYAGSGISNVWVKLTVIDEFGCTSTDSSEIQIPASVNNTFREFGINVYPQPTENSFKIEVPTELINAQISLMDATGRLVVKAIADKKTTEILTTDLPNGVYMLMLEKGQSRFNGKVIINR